MAQVESKTNISVDIEVVGRDAEKKGHFSLSSGNLYYYRKNAKNETARITYQQLIELIEEHVVEDE